MQKTRFFHEKDCLIGLNMIKVFDDDHRLTLVALEHDGYEGKIILCPGHDEESAQPAIQYLKDKFPSLTWKLS